MVHITLHIERLLVHNDCVIVPGLGGFVAHECIAQYVEEEELFLPPFRSVSFNQRLTMNDGLLVNDVAQHHHLEYKDAVRIVEEEVAKIREAIEQKGKYTFHGIGTLCTNEKGGYEFEPVACGVSAPDLYGLDSCYVTNLQKVATAPKKMAIKKHDDDTLTLRLHMNVVRYAAVAAVAAVFFFVCIAPLNSAIEHQRSEAGMFHYLYTLIVNSHNDSAPQVVAEEPAVKTIKNVQQVKKAPEAPEVMETESEKNVTEAEQAAPTPVEEPKPEVKEMPFAIVVASCVTERNANAMIDNWKTKGLTSAVIYDKGKYLRVFYGTYESYESAHAALKNLRAEHPAEFAEAWVYEIP